MDYIFITSWVTLFIITLAIYFLNEENHADSVFGWIWEGICGFLVSSFGALFFGSIIAGMIHFFGRSSLEMEERVVQTYDLVALDTTKDLKGEFSSIFFVGSGFIGEEMYYHFYYETSKGVIYKKFRADTCYIIETDEKPKYEILGQYYKQTGSVFYTDELVRTERVALYIPKGTIKSNYKVN